MGKTKHKKGSGSKKKKFGYSGYSPRFRVTREVMLRKDEAERLLREAEQPEMFDSVRDLFRTK